MPMRLIFLPNGGYFFDSTVQIYWTEKELDPFARSLIRGTLGHVPKVKQLRWLETVVQATGISSSFVSFTDTDGKTRIRHNLQQTHPQLAQWIDGDLPHEGDKIRISLGPYGQFFASSNCGYRWHGSDMFHWEIQSMMGSDGGWKDEWKPNGVVFGVNKSWLVTCEGGKHLCISPNLRTHYKDMCDELFRHFKGSDTPCGYEYISLNPYAENQYLVVWNNDEISWKLPQGFSAISAGVQQWLDTQNIQMPPSPSSMHTFGSSVIPSRPGSIEMNFSGPQQSRPTLSHRPTLPHVVPNSAHRPNFPQGAQNTHQRPPYSHANTYPGPSSAPPPYSGSEVLWGQPQHSTLSQMASFFQIVHAMTGIGKNVFEDQSGASSTSLLSQASMNSLLPMDPTSTFSTSTMVDATSLLTGGMPIDPFSVMGSMGLDPTSLSLQYGCVLM